MKSKIHVSGFAKDMFFLSLFSEITKMPPKPGCKKTKPDDWEGPQRITKPPSGCPVEELTEWLHGMKGRYHELNKADRKAYQAVRNAAKNRKHYTVNKEDPAFLAKKSEQQSVSNLFTCSKMNNFKSILY